MISIIVWLFFYFLMHSVLASQRTKARFAHQFGEYAYHGIYRLLYNAIALITLMPIVPQILSQDTLLYVIEPPLRWILTAFQISASIGLLASLLQIDWMQFAGISQIIAFLRQQPLPLPAEQLQTSGVYAIVRHPLYFFSLIVIWFTPSLTTGMLAVNLMVTLYVVIGSRVEEKRMLQLFGDQYRSYIQTVPWLLPHLPIAHRRKPS
jgi:methanethiol S-methyltransferase